MQTVRGRDRKHRYDYSKPLMENFDRVFPAQHCAVGADSTARRSTEEQLGMVGTTTGGQRNIKFRLQACKHRLESYYSTRAIGGLHTLVTMRAVSMLCFLIQSSWMRCRARTHRLTRCNPLVGTTSLFLCLSTSPFNHTRGHKTPHSRPSHL